MADGAVQQASAAEEVLASVEQMVTNIRQNTDNAAYMEQVALQAAENARIGGQAVKETVAAMQQIADKISSIEEIAQQTRLLAINATIEAVRAQEYGKGFSVVASEVRSLAEQTQATATEVVSLVMSSVAIAETAGDKLAQFVPDVEKTARLAQEVNMASREQHIGAEHINKAIIQLDGVIQQNAMTSEKVTSMTEALMLQAEQLHGTVGFFTIEEESETPENDAHNDGRFMIVH
jgi:methyl-accepting chemotaxis protein